MHDPLNLKYVPPGQESLNDYPGPKGFVEQLDSGIPIAHQPAKIRKALKQLDDQETVWVKMRLEYQARLETAERELREITQNRKKLRRLL